jgi:hypothetical protein
VAPRMVADNAKGAKPLARHNRNFSARPICRTRSRLSCTETDIRTNNHLMTCDCRLMLPVSRTRKRIARVVDDSREDNGVGKLRLRKLVSLVRLSPVDALRRDSEYRRRRHSCRAEKPTKKGGAATMGNVRQWHLPGQLLLNGLRYASSLPTAHRRAATRAAAADLCAHRSGIPNSSTYPCMRFGLMW